MVTRHKIKSPLLKGTNGNDKVEVCGWRAHLALVNLEIVTLADNKNAVFKDSRPEISNTKNLLCIRIFRNVTTTGARVAIIEDFFSLLESQSSTENRINSDVVEGISDYAIRL